MAVFLPLSPVMVDLRTHSRLHGRVLQCVRGWRELVLSRIFCRLLGDRAFQHCSTGHLGTQSFCEICFFFFVVVVVFFFFLILSFRPSPFFPPFFPPFLPPLSLFLLPPFSSFFEPPSLFYSGVLKYAFNLHLPNTHLLCAQTHTHARMHTRIFLCVWRGGVV